MNMPLAGMAYFSKPRFWTLLLCCNYVYIFFIWNLIENFSKHIVRLDQWSDRKAQKVLLLRLWPFIGHLFIFSQLHPLLFVHWDFSHIWQKPRWGRASALSLQLGLSLILMKPVGKGLPFFHLIFIVICCSLQPSCATTVCSQVYPDQLLCSGYLCDY